MGRDRRPPALPPGAYPNVSTFRSLKVCWGPYGGVSGRQALAQRSPRSGRFAAMRF